MTRVGLAAAAAALAAVSCVGGGSDDTEPVPSLFGDEPAAESTDEPTTTESTAPTTTEPIRDRLPELLGEVPGAVLAADGSIRAILDSDGEVYTVRGACDATDLEPAASAELVGAQHVVVDPGGDGADDLMLSLAEDIATRLDAEGVAVVLSRSGPGDVSAPTRGAVGPAVGAQAFVSLELGAAGDPADGARPTVFHQIDDTESRRLGGLVHQSLVRALAEVEGPFASMAEPGVRPLLNQRGEDYFGVLRSADGVPAVRVEVLADAARETALLGSEEGRSVIAAAVADAIARFLVTDEAGSGYVDPVETVRQAPTSNTPTACE